MTEENGRVDILVGLVEDVRAEVAEMRQEHADYRTAAALEQQEIQRLTAAVGALNESVMVLSARLETVEGRTGWLPTADRIVSYVGVATIGSVLGVSATVLFGL